MARQFTRASSQGLLLSSSGLTLTAPVSWAGWVYVDTLSVGTRLFSIGDRSTNPFIAVSSSFTAANAYEAKSSNATTILTDLNGSLSGSVWTHVGGVRRSTANNVEAYRAGAGSGSPTNTTNTTIFSADTDIVFGYTPSFSEAFGGRLAEWAVWNAELTASEWADLNKGVSPLLIRPSALISYWPMYGVGAGEPDLVGARHLSLVNAPTAADHPTIIRPAPYIIGKPAVTGPPAQNLTIDFLDDTPDTFPSTQLNLNVAPAHLADGDTLYAPTLVPAAARYWGINVTEANNRWSASPAELSIRAIEFYESGILRVSDTTGVTVTGGTAMTTDHTLLVDEEIATGGGADWYRNMAGSPIRIVLDLGSAYTLTKLKLQTSNGDFGPKSFEIFNSDASGSGFRTLTTISGEVDWSNNEVREWVFRTEGMFVSPAHLDDTDTLHAPTVTRGAVSVAPAHLDDTDSLYNPTITTGAVSVSPAHLSDTDTLHAPTITVGAPTIVPAHLADTDTLHAPTVTPGAVTVSPAHLGTSSTLYAPTVTQGGIVIMPPHLNDADTIYAPTLTPGAISVSPAHLSDSDTLHAPTVTRGAVTVAPNLFTDADTIFGPTLGRGPVTVAPTHIADSEGTFQPLVFIGGTGTQTLVIDLLDVDTFFEPIITVVATTIAPAFLDNGADAFYSPTLTGGAITISPAFLYDMADPVHNPLLMSSGDITFIGIASGTNTVTLPALQNRDVILVAAFSDGSDVEPGAIANFTRLDGAAGFAAGAAIYGKLAIGNEGGSTVSSSGATSMVAVVYRGPNMVLPTQFAQNTGTGTQINYPPLSMSKVAWAVGFAMTTASDSSIETPPIGMVHRGGTQDATDELRAFDTNFNVSSLLSRNVTIGGTSGRWRTFVMGLRYVIAGEAQSVTPEFLFDSDTIPQPTVAGGTGVISLIDWNLTLPVSTLAGSKVGEPLVVWPPDLLTLDLPPWFDRLPNGTLQFECPVDGAVPSTEQEPEEPEEPPPPSPEAKRYWSLNITAMNNKWGNLPANMAIRAIDLVDDGGTLRTSSGLTVAVTGGTAPSGSTGNTVHILDLSTGLGGGEQWERLFGTGPVRVAIDLGAAYDIRTVRLMSSNGDTAPRNFTIDSGDSITGPWTTKHTVSNPSETGWAHNEVRTYTIGASSVARAAAPQPLTAGPQMAYEGVNLAGAEFGDQESTAENQYTYPTDDELTYFASKGLPFVRLPIIAKRVFANVKSDTTRINAILTKAATLGMTVLLEDHHYGRDSLGRSLESTDTTRRAAAKAQFKADWVNLVNRFKHHNNVWWGLTNEPHGKNSEGFTDGTMNASANGSALVVAYNETIVAIRAEEGAGTKHKIVLCGTAWSGGHSWTSNWYGVANSVKMLEVVDSANNFAFDIHQYFDTGADGQPSYSGTYGGGITGLISPSAVAATLQGVTTWARTNNRKLILGEYNWPDTVQQGQDVGTALMTFLRDNTDVWLGHSFWAAGPWWQTSGTSNPLVIEPFQGFSFGNFNGQPIVDKGHIAIIRTTPPVATGFPRSELREIRQDWTNEAEWRPVQDGGGRIKVKLKVEEVAVKNVGGNAAVVIGQIRGYTADLCRLFYNNGVLEWVDDTGTTRQLVNQSSQPTSIPIGGEFEYQLTANSTECLVEAWRNGVYYSSAIALPSAWQTATSWCYFKVGCHQTVHASSGTGKARVNVSSLPRPIHPWNAQILANRIDMNKLDDGDTIYSPTVYDLRQTISPAFLPEIDILHAPTVSRGARTVTMGLLTDADIIYVPHVARGPRTVSPAFLNNGADEFYAPSVARAPIIVSPAFLTDPDLVHPPLVQHPGGAQTVIPSAAATTGAVFSPNVVNAAPPTQTLSMPFLADGDAIYAPRMGGPLSQQITFALLFDQDVIHLPTVAAQLTASGGGAVFLTGGL